MRPARLFEAAAVPLAGVSAGAFAALSAARRRRVFHPYGTAYTGSATFYGSNPLETEERHDALIRFSRGIGLPDGSPEFLGLAVKLPTMGQDLLLVTSGEGAVTRHMLIPSLGYFARPYSSVLPYEWDGRSITIGARAVRELRGAAGRTTDDLAAHAANGTLRFDLTWGPAGTGTNTPFGYLVVDAPYEGELAFNPFNSVSSLKPAGGLNRLRLDTYRQSQKARPDGSTVA